MFLCMYVGAYYFLMTDLYEKYSSCDIIAYQILI